MSVIVIFLLPVLLAVAYQYIYVTSAELRAIRAGTDCKLDPMQRAVVPGIIALVILFSVAYMWVSMFWPEQGVQCLLFVQLAFLALLSPFVIYYGYSVR